MKNKIDSDYGYIGNGEVQYVYRYIHPNYPWLYVGRTDDLTRRIDEHDKGLFDNIDEEYKNLLLESLNQHLINSINTMAKACLIFMKLIGRNISELLILSIVITTIITMILI